MRTGVLLCLLASSCLAQTGTLEGELTGPRLTDLSHMVVRLETADHSPVDQAIVNVSGDFRFLHLTQGTYTLVVTDESGNEIAREPVNIQSFHSQLKVELPEDRATARPQGPVSVSELRHPPERRALAAALKAQKLSESGDYRGAAAQLEKAVALDPQFAGAHTNLGAQYAHLGDFGRAEAEFRRAIALDPSSPLAQADLALVLARIGQTREAGQWARHALALDSTNPVARYVLDYLAGIGR